MGSSPATQIPALGEGVEFVEWYVCVCACVCAYICVGCACSCVCLCICRTAGLAPDTRSGEGETGHFSTGPFVHLKHIDWAPRLCWAHRGEPIRPGLWALGTMVQLLGAPRTENYWGSPMHPPEAPSHHPEGPTAPTSLPCGCTPPSLSYFTAPRSSREGPGKTQLTAVESRLREVQGPSQGHTASESPGWNPVSVSLLLPRALWAPQQLRNADGTLPSLWREHRALGGIREWGDC